MNLVFGTLWFGSIASVSCWSRLSASFKYEQLGLIKLFPITSFCSLNESTQSKCPSKYPAQIENKAITD